MGIMAAIGGVGILVCFLTGESGILHYVVLSLIFAVCAWSTCSSIPDVYHCVRDLYGTPIEVLGSVSSKFYEAPGNHYLVVDGQVFEVSAAQYHTVKRGDITALSYWPNIETVAGVDRIALPAAWPANAVRLAEALQAGENCAFALHDALLDAGYPELAEHFCDEPWPTWLVEKILTGTPPVQPRFDQ